MRNKSLTLVLADGAIAQESTQTIGAAPAQTPDNAALPFWQVVMMALIGGLILNLMPCVLPVLGMKLGSILLVEEKAALTSGDNFGFGRRYHCVIYGAGGVYDPPSPVKPCAGLGVQFQNAWFIGFMALVMLLFSASLFGLLSSGFPHL